MSTRTPKKLETSTEYGRYPVYLRFKKEARVAEIIVVGHREARTIITCLEFESDTTS